MASSERKERQQRASHRLEGPAVFAAGAATAKAFEVVCRAVTLVLRQVILRVKAVEFRHTSVARDLGQNGCCRNRDGTRVTVNERPVRG